jgi:hypothetical protein
MQVQSFFEFVPDWHSKNEARGIVQEYNRVLDAVLIGHPHLQTCLKQCNHCQIHFLTHPRNAGRKDLRCPFGCRQAHRKAKSTQRSTEYYRNDKEKKKAQNNRRRKEEKPSAVAPGVRDDNCIDPAVIAHIQVVTSLIEARAVTWKETEEMVRAILRQHSMGVAGKRCYLNVHQAKSPP